VRYFTPERLVNLCASLGIEVSFKNMPKCLTGAYGSLEGKTVIFICQEESFPGIKEHTIFHELREILEHSFKDLGFPSVTTGEELEKAAEDFAVQVRIALGRTVWTAMLEGTEKVESKLLRFVAFAFVVLGALVIEGSCALLPYFERVHSQSKT